MLLGSQNYFSEILITMLFVSIFLAQLLKGKILGEGMLAVFGPCRF